MTLIKIETPRCNRSGYLVIKNIIGSPEIRFCGNKSVLLADHAPASMVTSALDLKADFWLTVSLLLSVKDLIRLQATCRHLREVLSLDYVWSSALRDIMAVAVNPGDSPCTLSSLSSVELRHRAVLAARIERFWGRDSDVVAPRSSIRTCRLTDSGMGRAVQARLVRGGQWIVLLSADGTLRLQSAKDWEFCAEDVSFMMPVDSEVQMTLSLSAGTHKETLVLLRRSMWDVVYVCHALSVCDELTRHFADSQGCPSTTIAIFLIETNIPEPCFRQLMKVTRHHRRGYENSMAAEGNRWAFGWSHEGRQLLSVKNIPWNHDDVEKEVLIDIGEPIHATLALLSETQVLVVSCDKTSLYEIPPLQALPPPDEEVPIIRQEPIWTCSYQGEYNYPPISPICQDASSGRHEGLLAMITGTTLRFFTPTPEPSMNSSWIRTYNALAMEAAPSLSGRRAMWSAGCKLFVCTFPMPPGGDAGWMRLGAAQAGAGDERIASVGMPMLPVEGKIRDLSWDEASGRLCLLVGSPMLRANTIMIIDTP
ncbi:hypothetical protein HWV62_41846 [Athelia sp. TMB]|nr:hypothetical protein HWV62_41846 [Athelia sp. TMB]